MTSAVNFLVMIFVQVSYCCTDNLFTQVRTGFTIWQPAQQIIRASGNYAYFVETGISCSTPPTRANETILALRWITSGQLCTEGVRGSYQS
jgi:hypothetical protein